MPTIYRYILAPIDTKQHTYVINSLHNENFWTFTYYILSLLTINTFLPLILWWDAVSCLIYIFFKINIIWQYSLFVICSYAHLVLVLLSLFVCSLNVFVNAHYICIWSVTCAGVPSLTADVISIESRSQILWTTERNKSLRVPVSPVWKSIIMIFQSHHVLFCVILFWGWVGWKGNKPKYYLNCLLKLINN